MNKPFSIKKYVTQSNKILLLCDEMGYILIASRWLQVNFLKLFKEKRVHVSELIIDFDTNAFIELIEKNIPKVIQYKLNEETLYAQISCEKIENKYLIQAFEISEHIKAKNELEFVNKISELNFNRLHKILTQLENSQAALKENSKVRDLFMAKVSHEIRSPLNVIIGYAELLQNKTSKDEQIEYIQSINLASKNLLNLINNVLDFSKIESGKIEKNIQEVSILDLTTNIIKTFKHKALEKNNIINLKLLIPKNTLYNIDPNHYTQILINIITNAIKFTNFGVIEISISYKNFHLITSVKDNGIGIAKEEQAKIFEAFEQAKTSNANTNKSAGTGLGLSIVKQLTEINKGKIKLESTLNKGSKFTIALPTEQIIDKKIKKEEYKIPSKDLLLDKKEILLAEDQILNQKLIVKILTNVGANVYCVNNGKEAIEEMALNDYDLFITDINMPIMDGIEATKIARTKLKYKKPILCITADVTIQMREDVLKAGATEILNKPFQIHELQNILHKISDSDIDLTYFKKLANNDSVFFKEVIDTLVNQLEIDFKKLQKAIATSNFENILLLTHKIKGATSPLYNKELTENINAISNKAKNKNVDTKNFNKISIKINNLLNVLKTYEFTY